MLRSVVAAALALAGSAVAAPAVAPSDTGPRPTSPAASSSVCRAASPGDPLPPSGWPLAAGRLADPCQDSLRELGRQWER